MGTTLIYRFSPYFFLFLFPLLLAAQEQILVPETVFVKGGTFIMGNNTGQPDESPEHEVLVNDFHISKYEITVEQYQQFCEDVNKKLPKQEVWSKYNHPAIYVSWYDAVEYCKWLSKKTGKKFRLPTEAEWEFAARGGLKSKGYKYSGGDSLHLVGWCADNIPEKGTQPVGELAPNELGLYDMSGNVWEWCHDRYQKDYYKNKVRNNPKGPEIGNWRIVRGGSWADDSMKATCNYRQSNIPANAGFNDGFRVVLTE